MSINVNLKLLSLTINEYINIEIIIYNREKNFIFWKNQNGLFLLIRFIKKYVLNS